MPVPRGLFLFSRNFDLAQAETFSEEPFPATAVMLLERVVAGKRSAMGVFTPLFWLIPDDPLDTAALAGAVT